MKFKKAIILACCVIIAALGITLTGCELKSDEYDESSNDANVKSSNDANSEGSDDTNDESSNDTNDENDSDIDLNDEKLYLGTWKATITEESDGSVYDYEKDGPVTEMTLNADHKFSTRVNDDVYDDAGKWEFTKGGVKIMRNGFDPVIYTYKDGELLCVLKTENGKSTTHFVKK